MARDIVPHPGTFCTKHQRDRACGQRLRQSRLGFARETDAPVTGRCHVLERARQIDHADPGNHLQRARGRLADYAALGRRMSVLRHDRGGIEGGRRA